MSQVCVEHTGVLLSRQGMNLWLQCSSGGMSSPGGSQPAEGNRKSGHSEMECCRLKKKKKAGQVFLLQHLIKIVLRDTDGTAGKGKNPPSRAGYKMCWRFYLGNV